MINSVRNTVLAILNKNNYGYISPQDFNLYAKQAQLDLFEDYFYQYNYQVSKENARQSGTGYADIKKGYEEVIDLFSVTDFLSHQTSNRFFTPSLATTNSDYYLLNKVLVYPTILATGVNDGVAVGMLEDLTSADFIAAGVKVGDIVANATTGQVAFVGAVLSSQELELINADGTVADIFLNIGESYIVYNSSVIAEAEKVTHSKITLLNRSLLTTPNNLYPAYTQQESLLTVFPNSINEVGGVECQYIRYPRDPQWTYTTLTGGEPVFNQSNPSYQDFELPIDDEYSLVSKILQFAGMSIREVTAVQFGGQLETLENQEEK